MNVDARLHRDRALCARGAENTARDRADTCRNRPHTIPVGSAFDPHRAQYQRELADAQDRIADVHAKWAETYEQEFAKAAEAEMAAPSMAPAGGAA